jgi:hypothetical protein
MATRGKSARVKGHTFERDIAQKFRDLGWTDCETSRFASKKMDDLKVDLVETPPFYVQCKAVENLGPIQNVLAEMPQGKMINIVFHKKSRKGTIVAMTEDDFWKLLKAGGLTPNDSEKKENM